MDKELLIKDLKEFIQDLGKVPTIREFESLGPHSPELYVNKFGSWNNAIEIAGFKPNKYHSITKSQILKDIERVAEAIGKTPTLDEMEWHGKFGRTTYTNKLDSYVGALQKLGLEPSTNQYNFSNQPKPKDRRGTKNTRHLKEHGPTSSSKLPGKVGAQDKQHGLAKFSISPNRTGRPEPIYYLFEDHEPEKVIKAFFKTNPEILENRSRNAIVQDVGNYGNDWSRAIRKFMDDV